MAEIFLTEDEFCKRFHVGPRTAQRWRHTGEGGPPWVRLGLRRIGYREADCEAWAASRTFTNRAEELSRSAA